MAKEEHEYKIKLTETEANELLGWGYDLVKMGVIKRSYNEEATKLIESYILTGDAKIEDILIGQRAEEDPKYIIDKRKFTEPFELNFNRYEHVKQQHVFSEVEGKEEKINLLEKLAGIPEEQ